MIIFIASKGPWFTMPGKSRKSQHGRLKEKVNLSWYSLKSPVGVLRARPLAKEALETLGFEVISEISPRHRISPATDVRNSRSSTSDY